MTSAAPLSHRLSSFAAGSPHPRLTPRRSYRTPREAARESIRLRASRTSAVWNHGRLSKATSCAEPVRSTARQNRGGGALKAASVPVQQRCKQLRVPTIGAQFRHMAEEATNQKQSHLRAGQGWCGSSPPLPRWGSGGYFQ